METRCEVESDEFVFSHLKMPKPPTTRLISVLHGCIWEYDRFGVFFPPDLKIINKNLCVGSEACVSDWTLMLWIIPMIQNSVL